MPENETYNTRPNGPYYHWSYGEPTDTYTAWEFLEEEEDGYSSKES